MAEIRPSATARARHQQRRDPAVCSLSYIAFTRGSRPHSVVTPLGRLMLGRCQRCRSTCATSGRQWISPVAAPGPHAPQPLQKSLPARLNALVAHESPLPAAAASRRVGAFSTCTSHSNAQIGVDVEHICIADRQMEYAGHISESLRRGSRSSSASSRSSRSRYPSATRAVGG